MATNLAASEAGEDRSVPRRFPPANWGPWAALLGVVAALAAGIALGIPAVLLGHEPDGDLTTLGNVGVQLATALGFLLVPMALAAQRGAAGLRQILDRLGVRRFRPGDVKWMVAAVVSYFLFALVYALLIVEPHQKDIAEGFGALPIQALLIVVAAPISEEICFRGMLFGGLRERLPRLAAALVSGVVFGGLHGLTGLTAVPPLIVFGLVLALLYERTESIVPGILLHMLNNSIALLAQ